MVVEYVGEVINDLEANDREVFYAERGFGDCYMFKAVENEIIDASFKGNEARYLNHSCEVII